VERLRALVMNGATTYPGALAVEDCNGAVISLAKLDAKVSWGVQEAWLVVGAIELVARGHWLAARLMHAPPTALNPEP
jgi:hypothetical protein